MLAILAQTLLSLASVDGPVRFGVALPAATIQKGLTLRHGSALSWRLLPLRSRDGLAWVEVAAIPQGGRVALGVGAQACAPAFVTWRQRDGDGGTVAVPVESTRWEWADGTVDERRVHDFVAETVHGCETFGAGEALTVENPGLAARCAAAARLPRAFHERAGILPPGGPIAREVREQLAACAAALVELPGLRGAGDFARSGGVVTNLEFDTTLALLRLALAMGDEALLLRARRSALHLCDRDLDARSGLPFCHGSDHRVAAPEPGHSWLIGLLWTGAVCADERMLDAAQQIARGLAALPAVAEREHERARDYAWPLHELEGYLEWRDDPVVVAAADAMACAIAARYRPDLRIFCFGEGAFVDGPGYFERAWITGGVVLPALRAHLLRRPDRELQRAVDEATEHFVRRIGQGRGGLPTHYRVLRGSVFAEHRAEHDPKAFLMLEGLPPVALRDLLGKAHVRRGLEGTPTLDDPDLPTSFTLAARCAWVYR